VYFDIEKRTQLIAESTLGVFSISEMFVLLGISVARAPVTRNIAIRRRKLLRFDRTKSDYGPVYTL
jgi:hypothetical protein